MDHAIENRTPRARWNRWGKRGQDINNVPEVGAENDTWTKVGRRKKPKSKLQHKDITTVIEQANQKLESVEKDMNLLTKHVAEGINNLAQNEWQKFPEKLIIDSGAAETVMPGHWMANYKTQESQGSREGVFYLTASGEPIYNEGEKTLMLMNEYGQSRKMTFQCAKTTKALGSVSKICSNGNRVVFDDEGSYIENKRQERNCGWSKQREYTI